ncbi:periplasmic binding protein-like I [Obelidium mucronatum]|nr:periplasmic binding protein-like I [Obelidium mucronatum]
MPLFQPSLQRAMMRWMLLLFAVFSTFSSGQTFMDPIIGFYPGSSNISKKYENSITVAFLLPYNTFWNITEQSVYDACTFCGWIRQMDSAGEMVVNHVNNDPSILPNTMVNILRVQSWDQKLASSDNPGGAAIAALRLASHSPPVIAAFGDSSGTSTKMSAGVLSQNQIPMCGPIQNLPKLSETANYPYFFRTTYSNKWGSDIAILLNRWKVKRVAIIYDGDDYESAGACLDVKGSLFSNNIIVLSYMQYHGNLHHVDFEDIVAELHRLDARYMVLCAQGWTRSYDLINRANATGLISSKHVWIVTNPPYPEDYSGVGIDERLNSLVGMVYISPNFQINSAPNFRSIEERWKTLYEQDPLKYQIDYISWPNGGSYDCMGTILYSLDKFLKHPNYTPQMLGSGELQHRLTKSAFLSSGFPGISLNPMTLDSNGDMAANTIFMTLDQRFWTDGFQPPFGEVEKLTGEYLSHGEPTFYGGLTSPPADGPPILIPTPWVMTTENSSGRLVLSLIVIGYIVCLSSAAFLFRYRKHPSIKLLNIFYVQYSIAGSLLMLTSLVFYFQHPTQSTCYVRVWTGLIGFSTIVSPIVFKNIYIWRIFSWKTAQAKGYVGKLAWSLFIASVALSVIQMILLGLWMKEENYQVEGIIYDGTKLVFECRLIHNSHIVDILSAFNALIIFSPAIASFITKDVSVQYSESSLLVLKSLVLLLLALVATQMGFDENTLLKECICIWIAALFIPVVQVGSKALEVISETGLLSTLSSFRKSQTGGAKNGGVTSHNSMNSLKNQHVKGSLQVLSPKPNVRKIQTASYLTNMAANMSYRTKGYSSIWWSLPWKATKNATVCTFRRKSWMIIRSIGDEVNAYVLEFAELIVKDRIVYVLVPPSNGKGKHAFGGYQIMCEFGTEKEAQSFASDLRSTLSSAVQFKQ